jgi:hypothetical protein
MISLPSFGNLLIAYGFEVCDRLRSEDFSFSLQRSPYLYNTKQQPRRALLLFREPSITPFLECANLQVVLPMFALDWLH